jgi:hypothetical protein
MTISELIVELEEVRDTFGDIKVTVDRKPVIVAVRLTQERIVSLEAGEEWE